MRCSWRHFLTLLLVISVSSCVKTRTVKLPPITEGWHKASATKNAYIVQPKDTLYSIAWAFGMDYRALARANSIDPPYSLKRGQRLRIGSVVSSASPLKHKSLKKRDSSIVSSKKKVTRDSIKPLKAWKWPASGKIVAKYSQKAGGNKGVDIGGALGFAVVASNDGSVVYSGTGLRSYGKLIIIKHNDDYLSAYAYNKQILVVEGDEVKAGQKIATMGSNNDGRPALHFEIRRFGKPVDPLSYLPKK